MNKSNCIGIPVYEVKTPRGADLYKRIERIYKERMKRKESIEVIEKPNLELYLTYPEYKSIIDNLINEKYKLINEKYKYHPQPKNKLLAWLESIILLSIILSPIAITACAYFLVDFFLNH